METLVGIIDYRTGNSRSFSYALDHVGVPNVLVRTPSECDEVTHLALPGVGAAAVTMDSLREQDWPSYLADRVLGEGLPFLGVCVGLQVLFDASEEGAADSDNLVECLGWLPGVVRRFDAEELRVPHMGWNRVECTKAGMNSGIFPELFGARVTRDGGDFYFVNSYYADAAEPREVLGTTDYGKPFASVVGRGNFLATQFHVEKSGQLGLAVLKRFAEWDGCSFYNYAADVREGRLCSPTD